MQIIAAILEIIYLLLKNKFERDHETKQAKIALEDEARLALKNRDRGAIIAVLDKLRK